MIDDQYTSNGGAKFPIKWSPPEVLNYTRFSSKSDVWAFGVLCWEVFTCGEMPYGRSKNPEVVERVQKGQVLSRPQNCPHPIYEVNTVHTLGVQINVRVQINILAGKLVKNSKCTSPNKGTGWKC